MKEKEVGGTCGTHRKGKCIEFWWENPKERTTWKIKA
jgi:hypothetical protein